MSDVHFGNESTVNSLILGKAMNDLILHFVKQTGVILFSKPVKIKI